MKDGDYLVIIPGDEYEEDLLYEYDDLLQARYQACVHFGTVVNVKTGDVMYDYTEREEE